MNGLIRVRFFDYVVFLLFLVGDAWLLMAGLEGVSEAVHNLKVYDRAQLCRGAETRDCLVVSAEKVQGHDSSSGDGVYTQGRCTLTIAGDSYDVSDDLFVAAPVHSMVDVARLNGKVVWIARGEAKSYTSTLSMEMFKHCMFALPGVILLTALAWMVGFWFVDREPNAFLLVWFLPLGAAATALAMFVCGVAFAAFVFEGYASMVILDLITIAACSVVNFYAAKHVHEIGW